VPQNYTRARYWFEKAAAQGYAAAQTNLGLFYSRGLGVTQDYVRARHWYEKAAAQGHAAAQGDGPAQSALRLLQREGH
jgi:hypothetical protein